LAFLDDRPELRGIALTAYRCRIGATPTMEELLESTVLEDRIPHLHRFLARFGGTPVRDRATAGGNPVNASPIGALSVCLFLRRPERAWEERVQIAAGRARVGGQEQLDLETRAALAMPPDDGGVLLQSATQSLSAALAAQPLWRPAKRVCGGTRTWR
jgi:hypothetical protein